MSIELAFCDLCNESVPAPDLAAGRARRVAGRVICAACEAAMSHEGPRPDPAPGTSASQASAPAPGAGHSAVPAAAGLATQGEPAAPRRAGGLLGGVALVVSVGAAVALSDRAHQLDVEATAARTALEERLLSAVASARSEVQADLDTAARAREVEQSGAAERMTSLEELVESLRAQQAAGAETLAELEQLLAQQAANAAALGLALDEQRAELEERQELFVRDLRLQADELAQLEDTLRRLALEPAGLAGSPPAVGGPAPKWEDLLGDLTDPNPGQRLDAVYALGATEDEGVVPHLLGMLEDGDLFVRMATCRVLMDLGARSAVPGLIDALGDESSTVREAAMVALRSLTGKSFRYDPLAPQTERSKAQADWRAWWTREGSSGR